MGYRLPEALRQNLLYALGIVVMKSVSFFMLPFIASHLSPEAFGRLEILTTISALGAILVGFGMLNTLFRFAGSTVNPKERHAVVADVIGLNLSIGTIALALGLLASELLNNAMPGSLGTYNIRLAIGIVALEACIAIPLGWLRMNDRAGLFFLLNSGKAIIQALLVVAFLRAGRSVEGVMEAGLIAALLLALVLVYLQYRETGIRLRSGRIRVILVYSLPLVGSGLLGFVLNGLDRWIVADNVGIAEMALYAVAAKFALISALLLQPFLMWWSPRRFDVLAGPDGTKQAAKFAALGSALALLIAVVVGLSGPLFVEFLLPTEYAAAATFIPWLALLIAIKDSAELLNIGCYSGNTTNAQFYINLAGSLTGLIGMLTLIPWLGIWGAIGALTSAQLVRLALYLVISQRLLPLPYPVHSLLLMSTQAIAFLLLGQTLDAPLEQLMLLVLAVAIMSATLVMSQLLPVGLILRAA